MKVFVSAAPRVRALCDRELVEGFEADVRDGSDHVEVLALGAPAYAAGEDPSAQPEQVRLVGRARTPGAEYRGLPWWVVDREE
jgi:hypothetical protein